MEGKNTNSNSNTSTSEKETASQSVVQNVVLDYSTWTTFWEGLDSSQKSTTKFI